MASIGMIRKIEHIRNNIQPFRDDLINSIPYRNYSSKISGRDGIFEEFKYSMPSVGRMAMTLKIPIRNACQDHHP